ncbi:T6SS immunity protein Tli3 family protein, partial [Lonsdalea quercina]
CKGSDKGCLNVIAVTTDGGKTIRSAPYGSNTQDPNGDTKDYDMLVTNDGFYLINYWDGNRAPTNGSVDKWTFNPATKDSNPAYPGVTGPTHLKDFEMDVSKVLQERIQCDRTLEPVQDTGATTE